MTTYALIGADFKTDPWEHQIREFEISAELPARALLWQMRTGKTKMTIDKASHLFRQGLIDGLLIFAPNGVHQNWVVRELPAHAWDSISYDPFVWISDVTSAKAGSKIRVAERAEWEERRAAWYAGFKAALKRPALLVLTVNSESMIRKDVRAVVRAFMAKRRAFVVWDESSDFRTPGSSRSLMSRAIALRAPYRQILDGTIVTNSPLHAFSQYELLGKAALGFTTNKDFKDRYAVYEKATIKVGIRERVVPKLVGFKNLDELRERMAKWSSVVLRGDCNDLPDVIQRTRAIELNDNQVQAYKELHERTLIDIGENIISIGEKATKINKFQQIVSGFVIDEDKTVHTIPGPNHRLNALAEEVLFCSGKVIVFCLFQEEIDRVCARLRAEGHGVVEYHGRVSPEDKLKALNRFNDDPDVKVIVGQYASISRGLELSAAGTIIAYSHTFNAIHRQQGIERATKMMGSNVALIDFVAPGVDEYVLGKTTEKVETADFVAGEGMKEIMNRIAL